MPIDEREVCNALLTMKGSIVDEKRHIKPNREKSNRDGCGDTKKSSEKTEKRDSVEPLSKPPKSDPMQASNTDLNDGHLCDICGDVGYEHLLAVCCNCSDGAEHTYCMPVMMNKLPEGDWLCEECGLKKEKQKSKASDRPMVNKMKQNYGNPIPSSQKGSLSLGITGSGSGKSRVRETAVTKRKVFENVKQSEFSKPSSKMAEDSSSKNLLKGKMKQTREVTSSGRDASKHTLERFGKSPIFRPKCQVSPGSPSKSMLFKVAPVKVASMSKDRSLKEKYVRETSFNSSSKEVAGEKSIPTNNVSSDQTTARDSKVMSCDSSFVRAPTIVEPMSKDRTLKEKYGREMGFNSSSKEVIGVKKSVPTNNDQSTARDSKVMSRDSSFSYAKVQTSAETECSELHNPIISPPAVDSNVGFPISGCAFPQLNEIWKGDTIIRKGGKLLTSTGKIQAHLSTHASPNDGALVDRLPRVLALEEKPRLEIFAKEFYNHATEDDIALYFFANDMKSYEKNYTNVLNRMMRNDLALRGSFGDLELLIFASNLLPEESQRWNSMFFLWGLISVKEANNSSHAPIQLKTPVDDKNEDRPHCDSSPASASVSQNLCSSPRSCGSMSTSFTSHNDLQTPKSSITLEPPPSAAGNTVEDSGFKGSSQGNKFEFLRTNSGHEVYSSVKIEQLSSNVALMEADREERGSKRPRLAGSCYDGDENPEHKRLKSLYNGVDENDNSKSAMLSVDPFPVGLNFHGMHFLPKKIPFREIDAMPLSATNPKDSSSRPEPISSNLELSLCVKERSVDPVTLPLFGPPNLVNIQDRDCQSLAGEKEDDANEALVPLSLSLGIPFTRKEAAADLGSKWLGDADVNTNLSL